MDVPETFDIGREDLMRAPNRKRKTVEECRMPQVVKMTWDIDADTTCAIMEDLGVSVLMDVDDDSGVSLSSVEKRSETRPRPTPQTTQTNELVAPGAPRQSTSLMLPSTNHIFTETDAAVSKALHQLSPITQYTNQSGYVNGSVIMIKDRNTLDPWLMLADELMLSVFKWLTKSSLVRCARVNRRWNRVALDEALWRRLDLGDKLLKRGVIGRVLDRGVVVLRLAKSEVQTPLYLMNAMFIRPRSCRLQYLDLSMAAVNTQCLEQLLSLCFLLRKLSLENCQLNDIICRHIGQNKNMEVLNLCMCQGLTENSLVPICNNLQRLEELNVGWTNMSRGAVLYLVICLPSSLIKLNISGHRDNLTDEDVQQLCNSCPYLRELDLSDSTKLTSDVMPHIITGLPQLEYLALSRCYQILPSALIGLASMQTLLAFDVFGMLKETALAWLREQLSNIGHINQYPFSSIARPTTGNHRTSIWGLKVHDSVA